MKRNKTNKQYSARLSRWLDRLNHFDISLKHTAGKEIKFTDFINRNSTEKPEENYKEEFVINAIAQLATVNARIGRIFNQSETENAVNKTNMHDTRTLIDTRRRRANNSHIDYYCHSLQPLKNEGDFNYHTQPPNCKITANHSKMNNNNDENQNAKKFRSDRQISYHWGADDEIMAIINNREKSPETMELVRRRTELARPVTRRSQGNKGLGRELYVPRRPEDERREIKNRHPAKKARTVTDRRRIL